MQNIKYCNCGLYKQCDKPLPPNKTQVIQGNVVIPKKPLSKKNK